MSAGVSRWRSRRVAEREPAAGGAAVGRGLAWGLTLAVPLAFFTLFFVLPVTAMLGRGFVADGRLDLTGFAEVFARPRTLRIVWLTLAQASAATVVAVLLGVPGAYALYRCAFPGQRLLRAVVTVPFVLPSVVVGVAFRALLAESGPLGHLGLDGTFTAIVAALVFFNYALVVRTVGGFWAGLDPRTEQAARALGAPPWRAFVAVTLPALAPSIASAAAIVFLFCATAFAVVLVLGGISFGTIETEIWVQTTQFLDLRAAAVLSVLQLGVVVIALTVAGATRRRQERALAMRRQDTAARRPTAGDVPALALTGVVVAALALPMGALVMASLRTGSGWGLQNYANLATTGGANALSVTVWQATVNSMRTAVIATAIAMAVGTAVCVLLSRRPRLAGLRRGLSVLDAAFMLPLGVSAVTVGFGFLITRHDVPLLGWDLRSSPLLVPIAQAVVAVPLVVRTLLPVLRAIDPRLRQAAAVLGASPRRVLWSVDAAFAGRSAGLAVGLAFAVSLGEFGATSFLARPQSATLPVVIYRLIGRPGVENLGMAMAASVVLALLTSVVMLLAERGLRSPQVHL